LTLAKPFIRNFAVSARLSTKARSAQFNLSSLPGEHHFDSLAKPVAGSAMKTSACHQATLSKSIFEGTKKPIGCLCTTIDVLSLGRPPLWRPAKLSSHPPTRQYLSGKYFHRFQTLSFKGYRRDLSMAASDFCDLLPIMDCKCGR